MLIDDFEQIKGELLESYPTDQKKKKFDDHYERIKEAMIKEAIVKKLMEYNVIIGFGWTLSNKVIKNSDIAKEIFLELIEDLFGKDLLDQVKRYPHIKQE